MSNTADLLVINAAELLTCAGFSDAPARGPAQSHVGVVRDAAIAVRDGRIVELGASERIRKSYDTAHVVDAAGGIVLPGFVDPHTHLVFGGDRAAEWEERMRGTPYLEILRRGGGILSTVRATRAASFDALLASARRWAGRAMEHGTTTLEIKSGYCLDRDGELKLLEVVRKLADALPIQVVATFLGAHVIPPEHATHRGRYLDLLEELSATIAKRKLARFFDVFCEQEAFTLEEAERLLSHAAGLGLGLKLHAEQFTASGAAALGLRLGAASVDHLEHLSDKDLELFGSSAKPPVGVLLPGVPFHLGMDTYAPGRRLVDARVPIALATDFNPGSSFTPSQPMIIALACRTLGLSAAEAILGSTINAAHALGLGAETGSLEPGKRADLIVCEVPDHRWLGYSFGWNPVRTVIASGKRILG